MQPALGKAATGALRFVFVVQLFSEVSPQASEERQHRPTGGECEPLPSAAAQCRCPAPAPPTRKVFCGEEAEAHVQTMTSPSQQGPGASRGRVLLGINRGHQFRVGRSMWWPEVGNLGTPAGQGGPSPHGFCGWDHWVSAHSGGRLVSHTHSGAPWPLAYIASWGRQSSLGSHLR